MQNSPFRLPRVTPLGVLEFLAEWLLGLKALERLYLKIGGGSYKGKAKGKAFLNRVLQAFEVDYRVTAGSLSSLPKEGASVVVANHPFGGIEGVALADQLLLIRPDVKVLTNELLCRIPDLQDVFIGVGVLGSNARGKTDRSSPRQKTG